MNKNLIILIIVAFVILGGVYFIANQFDDDDARSPESIEQLSSDTSLEVIDQELDETNIDTLDQEFADIDAELEATLNEL